MTVSPPYNNMPRPLARAQAPIEKPLARGQMPAEAPTALKIPAPEELGIRLDWKEAPLDWNQLREQLDKIGARSFQLEKRGAGFRFACEVSGRNVEGIGGTEREAVRLAMLKLQK